MREESSENQSPAEIAEKGESENASAAEPLGFPVVGIGASAGGLEALNEFFENLPLDTGMAFVVVTHQPPGQVSLLPELLGKETALQVAVADEGTRLEPNHVYVVAPGGYLAVLNGTLHRMESTGPLSPRLPIDYFFRSLAKDQGELAIGVVLSGTGSDGTQGVKAIKGEAGMVMVQQPTSAKYAGMPSSAEGTGLADYVLPPAAMPRQLVAYGRGPYLRGGTAEAEPPAFPVEPLQKIFLLLRDRTGNDFSAYKPNTIRRRIERRMNVQQIEEAGDYVRYLQENPQEIDFLFKELLISVTCFFRDPEAWVALEGPLTRLIESRVDGDALRVWVPGCASGEEVYSMAMLLRECTGKVKGKFDTQIFGTDLDGRAIDMARTGLYPGGIAADVSPERLAEYFTPADSAYRICKEIREMAVFALQNVIKDPPFTKLDLVSCRNLMIYLNADLQKRLLPVFHYVLKPGGLLFLGPSESIGGFVDLFETVDKKWKIFRRRETPAGQMPEMPISTLPPVMGGGSEPLVVVRQGKGGHAGTLVERLALERFCPTFVLVNDRGDIVHVHGRTGEYLELAEGQARMNVMDMAREGLSHELALALRQAVSADDDVVRENIGVRTNRGCEYVNLTVTKIREPEPIRGLLMVVFRPVETASREGTQEVDGQSDGAPSVNVDALERELRYVKESYQTALEELETSNEEQKSTNEELQSTNEELETSKEEMQSLNEELTTVNTELQSKVEDLSQANDDMRNLLNSTDIATIFLDNDLNIKSYTEQGKEIVKIRASDIGRPIDELASNLKSCNLAKDCSAVLDTLAFKKLEVETNDGSWYLMRIMPYRTTDRIIDGLVLTFVNIDDLKAGEKAVQRMEFFESIFDTVRQPLIVLDAQQALVSGNRAFYETFRLRASEVVGATLWEIDGGEWDLPALHTLLDDILPGSARLENFRLEHTFPRVGRKSFLMNARRLDNQTALPGMSLLAMEEVTDRA